MVDERAIVDSLACGVVLISPDGIIRDVNGWILHRTSRTREMTIGSPVHDLLENYAESDRPQKVKLVGSVDPTPVEVISCSMADLDLACLTILPLHHSEQGLESPDPGVEDSRDRFHGLIGRNPSMHQVYHFIEMAAATDANVVIQGESGTGKELVASAIHHVSHRCEGRFVRVNCAALTETLLESELFGHAKGAFTGAYRDHVGKFEFANGGTIFLDEIGEISPAMQAKLLRVLQERIIVRVGDNQEIAVDVRVVVATNKNLRALVSKGKFREDLFYRLNVFPIHLPSLRERGTDIPLLVQHFIDKFSERTGKQITSCSSDAMRILLTYCWPGNVRELENTIEHAFILCRGDEIQAPDLPHELRVKAVREGICAEKVAGIEQRFYPSPIDVVQKARRIPMSREALEAELERNGGNKAATARALGISKVALWKRMKKWGMM